MDPYELITKKKNAEELTDDELKTIVHEFTDGALPDYQMSAFLMAVWFCGMTARERAVFTREMVDTGITLSYPDSFGTLVDKHSTGGVGDGVSLALVPLVAHLGVKIPMMSGRGLGHTGGTLDKLESIPGFEVELDVDQINEALETIGAVMIGQTGEVAPADRKMYALRDVTATVDSVDLIAASIMSKKIAEGMDALVLDVKTGSGAFMTEYENSVKLARAMVEIGTELGKTMSALITNMDQPLGRAVGNAIEMNQAIEIVKGTGPADLTELTARLASEMLVMGGVAKDHSDGYQRAFQALQSGAAVQKLRELIEYKSGNPRVIDDPSLFPDASEESVVESLDSGYVGSLDAFEIGMASKSLGAGRETVDSEIDHGAGIYVEKKIGDSVEQGEPLARLLYNTGTSPDEVTQRIHQAYKITEKSPEPVPLVYSSVDQEGNLTTMDIERPG